jgi:hypothetical protein
VVVNILRNVCLARANGVGWCGLEAFVQSTGAPGVQGFFITYDGARERHSTGEGLSLLLTL